jgi:hypothetical protein
VSAYGAAELLASAVGAGDRIGIRQLVSGQEAVVRAARNAFTFSEEAEDQVTIDVLTERMLMHEEAAWMLRSLLSAVGSRQSAVGGGRWGVGGGP